MKSPLSLPIEQIYEIDGEYYKIVSSYNNNYINCKKCDLKFGSKSCRMLNINCNNTIFKKIDKYEVLFSIEKDSDK